jgi:hypothetical protein
MNQKLNVFVALAGGLIGSAIMHYVASPVFAQDQTPVAKEVRAQSFALVDQSNNVIGVFTSEPVAGSFRIIPAPGSTADGAPVPGFQTRIPSHIVLKDANGRVIWTPDNNTKILPLSMRWSSS